MQLVKILNSIILIWTALTESFSFRLLSDKISGCSFAKKKLLSKSERVYLSWSAAIFASGYTPKMIIYVNLWGSIITITGRISGTYARCNWWCRMLPVFRLLAVCKLLLKEVATVSSVQDGGTWCWAWNDDNFRAFCYSRYQIITCDFHTAKPHNRADRYSTRDSPSWGFISRSLSLARQLS